MSDTQTAAQIAQATYERDTLFRRAVDAAVHESMTHFDHVESEAERRDLHHAMVLAARAALRLAIDGDRYLHAMEFERDAAKRQLENMAKGTPGFHFVQPIVAE